MRSQSNNKKLIILLLTKRNPLEPIYDTLKVNGFSNASKAFNIRDKRSLHREAVI